MPQLVERTIQSDAALGALGRQESGLAAGIFSIQRLSRTHLTAAREGDELRRHSIATWKFCQPWNYKKPFQNRCGSMHVRLRRLFLLWNVLLILGGHRAGYFQTVLNLTVLLAINLKSPYSRFLLKVWCALPVISIGIYLLLSVMHRHWSQDSIDHVVGALLVLPVFIQLYRPAERPGDLQ